jgi:carbamoyltransferase
VALNCVGNGRILREGPFKRLWIQPAAGMQAAQLVRHSSVCICMTNSLGTSVPKKIRCRAVFFLREKVADYFEMDADSPYMLLVAPVRHSRRVEMTTEQKALWGIDLLNVPRSDIPDITHVDYSARVQMVHHDTNPRYYALIKEFERLTGCGVLVNTSFNVRGEPIVCSPQDAFRCFMRTEMDVLVLENCILYKEKQKPLSDDFDWRKEFELD